MIANIKAMTETLKKMEEMQKEVTKEVNKDINQKRHEALAEIRAYLDELAESLDGRKLSIDLPDGTVFGNLDRGQRICFNCTYTIDDDSFHGKTMSEETKNWYLGCYSTYRKSDTNYWYYIDNCNATSTEEDPTHWACGFINLIENWKSIKQLIETGIEKEMTRKMEDIRKATAEKIAKYEKVTNFQV